MYSFILPLRVNSTRSFVLVSCRNIGAGIKPCHHLWATFRRPPRSSASLGKCQATRLASASALGIFSCVEVLGRPEKCMGSRLLWRWRLFVPASNPSPPRALISRRPTPRAHATELGHLGAAGSVDPRGQGLDVRNNWRLVEVSFIIYEGSTGLSAVGLPPGLEVLQVEDRPVVSARTRFTASHLRQVSCWYCTVRSGP